MIIDVRLNLFYYKKKGHKKRIPFSYYCPDCKEKVKLWRHGTYWRHIVYWNGRLKEKMIPVQRMICKKCGHTHSILPYDVIPGRVFGLSFFIYLFKILFYQRKSVLWCERKFHLSHSYLYLFIKTFYFYFGSSFLFDFNKAVSCFLNEWYFYWFFIMILDSHKTWILQNNKYMKIYPQNSVIDKL